MKIFITNLGKYCEGYLVGKWVQLPISDDKLDEVLKEIIFSTYRYALDHGDKNVYFIDGSMLFGEADGDACTVDGCHPNDLGFYRMARGLEPVLRKILENDSVLP